MKVYVNGSQETRAFTYRYRRGISKAVDVATVILDDLNGSATADYLPQSSLYHPIYIEDPDGTKVFDGRIRDISTRGTFVILECEGWLSQHNDMSIESYNTKEILLSPTYRDGVIGSVSGAQILDCTVNSQNPSWTTNQWANGNYAVVFPDNLSSVARIADVYAQNVTHAEGELGFVMGLWWDYSQQKYFTDAGDEGDLRTLDVKDVPPGDWDSGHAIGGTPWGTIGNPPWFQVEFQLGVSKTLLVSNGLDIHVHAHWWSHGYGGNPYHSAVAFRVYNWNTSAWVTLLSSENYDGSFESDLTSQSNDYVSDSGVVRVRMTLVNYDQENDANSPLWDMDYCKLTIHYNGVVQIGTFPITANTDNDITSSADFANAGVQASDPFVICKKSSENIKALVQTYDTQKTFTVTNVFATSKYPPREWKEATAFQIISELADEDDCDFWVDLSQNFYYNKTPTSPTKIIDSDDRFLDFGISMLGSQLKNEAHIWGYKYPSPSTMEVHQVRTSQSSKDTFGLTKTHVERDTSIYTAVDANTRGDAILSKSSFPKRQFTVVLVGKLTTDGYSIDVGETVNLILSKYSLNENLIVVGKAYDPIRDEMTYEVAYCGSAGRYVPTDLLRQLDNLGRTVYRLMVQSAQR